MLLTGAVQTSMLGAARACLQKLFAQSRTRAVDANAGVRSRDAVLLSEFLHALFSQIDGTKNLRVLRFQAVEDGMKTGTDLVLKIRRWLSRTLQLPCPRFKSFVFRNMPSVAVNHSIPEQTVKPGHSRFAGPEVVPMLNGAQVRALENIFGQPGIRDAALHKRKEPFALGKKLFERCFAHKSARQEA